MHVIDLISQLAEHDIRLWLDNGQLRFSAPPGGMSDAVRDEIRAHRQAIINFLDDNQPQLLPPITPVDYTQPQPLSFAQERIWFLSQLEPASSAFHLQNLIDIRGPLDRQRLQQALAQLVERHTILRTAYRQDHSGVWQQILPATQPPLPCQQLADASPASLAALAADESRQPFDLAAGQVFRNRLLQAGEQHFFLLSTVHHIATDGWSMALLADEILSLYQQDQALPPPALQYMDVAVWQRRQARPERQLQYWQQQLADVPPLNLPVDYSRPALPDHHGASRRFTLDAQQTAALEQLARQHDATLFMVLLALFAVLLKRYSQQNDFCIGTPVAGRLHSGCESLIGCFVNMLAIRCRDNGGSFADYLANVRDTVRQALAHQDVPFEQVVQQVVASRDLAVSPLFQVMFALQELPQATRQLGQLQITPLETGKHSTQYDLSLSASLVEGRIEAELSYRSNLFAADTIDNMIDSLQRLADAAIADAGGPLYKLPCISSQDRQQQLQDWNQTSVQRNELPRLQRYIEQQAAATPSATAVVFDGQSLDYRTLNRRANRLARHLKASSRQPVIGVYLERSLQLPVVLLAILKSGKAYLPLDLAFPPDRLNYVATDAQLDMIVSHSSLDNWAMPAAIQRLDIDCIGSETDTLDDADLADDGAGLFNLIYTSGSTGFPKGVLVSHSAIINRLLWMQEQFPLTSSDNVLHKTPYSFDVSVWELFWPLLSGATLVIAPPGLQRQPDALLSLVDSAAISIMHFVPSMLGVFLAQPTTERGASLRCVFSSGESLSGTLATRFLQQFPHSRLVNLYGPTEAAIDVSFHNCQAQQDPLPIGRPIANTTLYLLDSHRQLLPTGAVGEIYIGGRNLADGYLNLPQQTAAAFIAHPFSPGERLYKTGDLGRFDRQGRLYYLGRSDQQVKIRGVRIELAEIEQQLNRYPAVRECRVLARGEGADMRLMAWLLSDGPAPDSDMLRRFLQKQLPDYMIPAQFVALDSWPLTSHGKIDSDRLPPASGDTPARGGPPRNATEQAVADIWAELLGRDDIGIDDDFFALGGHSLLAARAMLRMQEHFHTPIPLSDIFREPTIATIAAVIDQARQADTSATAADDEEEIRL
ncbi:MAG TPA: amino acid adenylation domain-containing protein [Pseudomonadales bacterium]